MDATFRGKGVAFLRIGYVFGFVAVQMAIVRVGLVHSLLIRNTDPGLERSVDAMSR